MNQCKAVSWLCVFLMIALFYVWSQKQPTTTPVTEYAVFVSIPEKPVERTNVPFLVAKTANAVGYLRHDASGTLYPLYAQPSPTHRYRFNYHTVTSPTDTHFKLPVFHNNRDCTERFGCDELYDNSQVTVPGVDGPLTVKMYSRDFV